MASQPDIIQFISKGPGSKHLSKWAIYNIPAIMLTWERREKLRTFIEGYQYEAVSRVGEKCGSCKKPTCGVFMTPMVNPDEAFIRVLVYPSCKRDDCNDKILEMAGRLVANEFGERSPVEKCLWMFLALIALLILIA
jgi:hypothetical protein